MPALPQAAFLDLFLQILPFVSHLWGLHSFQAFPSICPIMQHKWALMSEKAQALEDIQIIRRGQHNPLSNDH
jgi:hypothetical protein